MNETGMTETSAISVRWRAARRVVANAALAVGLCSWATPARAANSGFFSTYTSDVERGEFELMLMNDFTRPSTFSREEDGFGNYLSHSLELEYGVTDQFATELITEWFEEVGTGDEAFTGFRWESRYRLFKRTVPLNPMVYVEYEDLDPRTRNKMEVSGWVRPPYTEATEDSERERELETRLVLSHDVGPLEVAFNWVNETDLESGTTAFGYSLGVLWMRRMAQAVQIALGLEAYGGLGDTTSFGFQPERQEHYLAPTFMYHVDDGWMFQAQLAIGLSAASDQLVRLGFGYEF
jgi:hypothetical protein